MHVKTWKNLTDMVVIIHNTIMHQLFILQLRKYGYHYIIAWRNHHEGANHDLS